MKVGQKYACNGTAMNLLSKILGAVTGESLAWAATMRIDPVNRLVTSMTRDRAGRTFSRYHPPFIAAVVAAMCEN